MKFLILALIIAGLAVVDVSLEKTERRELAAEANDFHTEGLQLLAAGKADEAAEKLRQAYILERRNRGYQLSLVEALTAAHKNAEADQLLDDILLTASNDGRSNLVAARLKAAEGKPTEAEAYYHRAIYGSWPGKPENVRLELINYLASQNRHQALLAELIPLEEESGPTERIAQLFVQAGSPGRAAQAYQTLGDYAGLGQARLEGGDYGAALNAFLKAFGKNPNDMHLRKRMELASSMAALDPTPRRMSSREKFNRSLRILNLAQTRFNQCTQSIAETPQPDVGGKVEMTNEKAEANLTAAEQIWKNSVARCGPSTAPAEEPLRLIMQKLAQ